MTKPVIVGVLLFLVMVGAVAQARPELAVLTGIGVAIVIATELDGTNSPSEND
jgi:hypothetical protein